MRRLVLFCAMLALSGCYKTNLTNFGAGGGPGTEVKVWNHAVLAGLIPLSDVEVKEHCGDKGVWAVSTRVNGWQVLLGSLTMQIYSPTTARITCKSG